MADIIIRDAHQGDVPALVRLIGQLDPPDEAPDEAAARAALETIDRQPGMRIAVAEAGGTVVGAVMLAVLPNLSHHASPWAQMENLVVDEAHRRQGVGRALMAWCDATARDAGCYKLQFPKPQPPPRLPPLLPQSRLPSPTVGFRKYLNGQPPPP